MHKVIDDPFIQRSHTTPRSTMPTHDPNPPLPSPKVEDTILKCPRCNDTYLHHAHVVVNERDHEDGPGTHYTIRGKELSVSRKGVHDGRRNDLRIGFWCEICDEESDGMAPPLELVIRQHKGVTIVRWIRRGDGPSPWGTAS